MTFGQVKVTNSYNSSDFSLSSCSLFVPVVNLEKISSLPKPDGDGIRAPPKPADSVIPRHSASTKEILGKSLLATPRDPLLPAKAGGISIVPADGLGRKLENLGEKEAGAGKSLKKMPRESSPHAIWLALKILGSVEAMWHVCRVLGAGFLVLCCHVFIHCIMCSHNATRKRIHTK